jgi:galactokinase
MTLTAAKKDVIDRCVDRLINLGHDRDSVRTLFVPGRVEILGKHTDYCGGRSVTCAIDRGIHVAFAAADVARITAVALDLGDERTFDFTSTTEPARGWANYPTSVARRLARNFDGPLRGATFVFSSTLPQAAGMSSSSALVIATFLVLDAINGFAARAERNGIVRTPFELAEYLGTLENGQSYRSLDGDRGVGTFGGSEDHTAITLGQAGRLGVYGYSPTRLERAVELPVSHVLAIASSGVVAEKTGAARDHYNRAALLVRELIKLWNDHEPAKQQSLAAVVRHTRDAIDRLRQHIGHHVSDPLRAAALLRRLDHFLAESERVIPTAIDALSFGDLISFGHAVDESQRLAEKLLDNQVPETTFLADAGRELGAAAASSFGAGFGGSVWALIEQSRAPSFLESWRARYHRQFVTAQGASFFLTKPADGTGNCPYAQFASAQLGPPIGDRMH